MRCLQWMAFWTSGCLEEPLEILYVTAELIYDIEIMPPYGLVVWMPGNMESILEKWFSVLKENIWTFELRHNSNHLSFKKQLKVIVLV